MSDVDDVWRPAEDAPISDANPAAATYGEGLWINQAFSLDTTFRVAIGVLRERPLLVLGVGALMFVLGMLPTCLSMPLDVGAEVARVQGGEEAALGVELLSALVTFGAWLVVFPLQQLVMAGGLRAMARLVETGDTDVSLVWRSVPQALRMFGNSVLVGLIVVSVSLVVMAPTVGGGIALMVFDQWGLGLAAVVLGTVVGFGVYLYVALPLALGVLACAIDDAGPIQGLQIAWTAGSGARATLFVFGLVYMVLFIVGACLMCVGQIPVYGMMMASAAGGWVLYARPDSALRESPFFQRNPIAWL